VNAGKAADRRVLHVLPHPGGGGETYFDLLASMPGHVFTRVCLTRSPRAALPLAHGLARVLRAALQHDLVHVQGEVAAFVCLPALAVRPAVVTLNGLHLVRRLEGRVRDAAVLNLRLLLRAARCTICVSETEYEHVVACVGRRAAARAVVIPNGVDLPPPADRRERARVRAELGIDDGAVVGAWVGSLDERKDPLTALRAAARSRVQLLLLGDGPLRGEVERAAGPGVHVLGERSDVREVLAAADFFVLSSHREGLAFALLEAMAGGLPAIVTELPENVEAVGKAGIVIRPGDEDALAAAFHRLATDEHDRVTLGEQARRRVENGFRADEMRRRTQETYEDVLTHR
jgi:glycosyltransferase involved in cell wall biosynthesis